MYLVGGEVRKQTGERGLKPLEPEETRISLRKLSLILSNACGKARQEKSQCREISQWYYLWFLSKFQWSSVDRKYTIYIKWKLTMKDRGIEEELLLWVFIEMKRRTFSLFVD